MEVFFSEKDERTGRNVIIEEAESIIWVYLTHADKTKIEKDCFLGSRLEITKIDVERNRLKGERKPPKMIKGYSTEFSFIPEIENEDFDVMWFPSGDVLVKIKGNPFLCFYLEDRKGFSKSIGKDGIYGNAWKEERYCQILK